MEIADHPTSDLGDVAIRLRLSSSVFFLSGVLFFRSRVGWPRPGCGRGKTPSKFGALGTSAQPAKVPRVHQDRPASPAVRRSPAPHTPETRLNDDGPAPDRSLSKGPAWTHLQETKPCRRHKRRGINIPAGGGQGRASRLSFIIVITSPFRFVLNNEV